MHEDAEDLSANRVPVGGRAILPWCQPGVLKVTAVVCRRLMALAASCERLERYPRPGHRLSVPVGDDAAHGTGRLCGRTGHREHQDDGKAAHHTETRSNRTDH